MTKDFPERFNDRAAGAIMCSWNNVHCVGGYILYALYAGKNRIRSIEISLKYFDPATYRNEFFKGDCTRYFENIYKRGVNNVEL